LKNEAVFCVLSDFFIRGDIRILCVFMDLKGQRKLRGMAMKNVEHYALRKYAGERIILVSGDPSLEMRTDANVFLDISRYGDCDFQRLLKTAARMRPDRIIVDTDDKELKAWIDKTLVAASVKVDYLSDLVARDKTIDEEVCV